MYHSLLYGDQVGGAAGRGCGACLGLTDDRFPVMARDVVELDTVVVEVVEDGQAPLVALAVVRLGTVSTAGVGPLV